MGEHAFDQFLTELIARGVPSRAALNLCTYFEPNWRIDTDSDTQENIDSFLRVHEDNARTLLQPENSYDDDIPEECLECVTFACNECIHAISAHKNNNEFIESIQDNYNLNLAKIYVDNSNMLFGSSRLINEIQKKSKKQNTHSTWYLVGAIVLIDLGREFLTETPNIFMASNGENNKRGKWLNFVCEKFNCTHHNVEKKYFKMDRKVLNSQEDEIMKKALAHDMFENKISHFVICTGDGNKDSGYSFLEIVKNILLSGKKVSLYGFENCISNGYYPLLNQFDNFKIHTAGSDFFSFRSLHNKINILKNEPY